MKSPTTLDYENISAALQTSSSLLTTLASNMRAFKMQIFNKRNKGELLTGFGFVWNYILWNTTDLEL